MRDGHPAAAQRGHAVQPLLQGVNEHVEDTVMGLPATFITTIFSVCMCAVGVSEYRNRVSSPLISSTRSPPSDV